MISNVINVIRNKAHYSALSGATDEEIEKAQTILNTSFAEDYKDYIREFGIVSYQGHELTGICGFERLNVVDVTLAKRRNNPKVPQNYYVIEQTNMDGAIIWQDSTGVIYRAFHDEEPERLCGSLMEYVDT